MLKLKRDRNNNEKSFLNVNLINENLKYSLSFVSYLCIILNIYIYKFFIDFELFIEKYKYLFFRNIIILILCCMKWLINVKLNACFRIVNINI